MKDVWSILKTEKIELHPTKQMDRMYSNPNSSSRNSLKSASTYEDVSHVSHVIKPVRFDSMLEPPIPLSPEHPNNDEKIYKVNLNILPIFFLELIALGCLGALAYVMRFSESIPVLSRFTACNPQTEGVSMPLNMSSFDNVYIDLNYTTLYITCTIIPLGVILLGEVGYFLFSQHKKVVRGGCISCRLYLIIRRLVRFGGVFIFGLFAVSILTDGLKFSTGKPRPYYHFVCADNFDNYKGEERNARLSFPSYYASISTYSAVYLMAYLHFILSIRASRLLRPSLVFAIGSLALLCGASRVALHYNFWEDVVVGHIIGAAAAIYLSFSTLECFGQRTNKFQAYNLEMASRADKPLFFRYFRIPHVSYRNKTGLPYPENMSPSPELPNEFISDLHQRIDYKRDANGHI